MRALDLFSGLEGWSRAFRERGHDVTTLDLGVDGKFHPDFALDILDVKDLADLERGGGRFDVILASPPCTAFSVAAMGKNWIRHETKRIIVGPKHPRAELGMRIALHTFNLIDRYVDREGFGRYGRPNVRYVIENPIGALRVMPFAAYRNDRRSTWYCRWDDRRPGLALPRAKPTDLFTNFGGEFPICRPGHPDHEAAPRGARTGTQGMSSAAERSLIPYALSLAFCVAAEGDGVVVPLAARELALF